MADGLTDAAKAEIAAAIAIVRQDKFEGFARGVFDKFAPKEPKKDELIEPKKDEPPTPPPPKDEPPTPPPTRKSSYWGEILDD